jgi:hypothetical protein
LGSLALKANTHRRIRMELGGQAFDRSFQTERLELTPLRRLVSRREFFSLAYLHTPRLPDGEVGLHSPALDQTLVIAPAEWDNIWVYGLEIYLAGYLTRLEFHRLARRLPAGSRVLQYRRTRTENFSVPVARLRPMKEILSN